MGNTCSTVHVVERYDVERSEQGHEGSMSPTSTATTHDIDAIDEPPPLRIRVTNMRERETVTHPLVLVEGHVENMLVTTKPSSTIAYIQATANEYSSVDDNAPRRQRALGLCWPVVPASGHFKAYVLLPAPGRYAVHLQIASASLVLHMRFAPPATKHVVRFHYQKPYDSTQGFDVPRATDTSDTAAIDRIKLHALVLQTALAELLHRAGSARRSFALEFGVDGLPAVYLLRSQYSSVQARTMSDTELLTQLRADVARADDRRLVANDTDSASAEVVVKHVVILDDPHFDPRTRELFGHREVANGNVVVMSACGLHTWPRGLDELTMCCLDTTRFQPPVFLHDCGGHRSFWTKYSASSSRLLQLLVHSFGVDSQREGVLRTGFYALNRLLCVYEPTPFVHLPTFTTAIGDGRFAILDYAALVAVRGSASSSSFSDGDDVNGVYLDALSADTLAVKCAWIASRRRRRASSLGPRKSAAAA